MDAILKVLIVIWLINTSENIGTATLLQTTKDISSNTSLCQLPPYPKRGGYVVLGSQGAGGAGPGQVFSDVSLVEYMTDRDRRVFEIKRLSCSAGEWERDIFQYDGKALYFYTSWCPYFCSSFSSEQYAECSTPNIDKELRGEPKSRPTNVTKRLEANRPKSQFCRLPPYPSHGTYVVQNKPAAVPGDVFPNVSLIQYTSDQHNKVVTIEHYKCSAGVWYQKIFQEASESLYFYSDWCPALCSQCFGEKLAGRQYSLLSSNETLKKKTKSNIDSRIKAEICTAPPYPEFGNYTIINEPKVAQPENLYDELRLNYTCSAGYSLFGKSIVRCLKGVWSEELPICAKICHLIKQPSVEYFCGEVASHGDLKPCGLELPEGSVVTPRCSSPYYRSKSPLKPMICVNGEWDNVPDCKPVCGLRVQDEDLPTTDSRIRAPWHVAIFEKRPAQIRCGGSIIAHNLVISAAERFFDIFGRVESPINFVAVAGKLYRSWYQPNDDGAQRVEVAQIITSPWFTGVFSVYQHDIALVFLATSLIFNVYVWPVCVNFDKGLDETQLTEGRLGTVAGWGRSDRGSSEALRVVELPNIEAHKCVIKALNTKSRYGEQRHITTDKICAGYDNGTPLCEEDNGGGFVVAEPDPQDSRKSYHYLRGVVSLYNRNLCNEVTFSVFTKVSAHENFIKSNSVGIVFST